MAIVKFNVTDEFIDELKKCRLEAPIVRLTNLYKPIPNLGPIRALLVVATTKASNGDIIRLERYCGQIWDIETQDKDTLARADEIHNKIENACEGLGIEVRAGIIEETA